MDALATARQAVRVGTISELENQIQCSMDAASACFVSVDASRHSILFVRHGADYSNTAK